MSLFTLKILHHIVSKNHAADYYSSGAGVGRPCNATITGRGSCIALCCRRGHNTERRMVAKKCNCKFHWCCYVKCDMCDEEVEVHTCRI